MNLHIPWAKSNSWARTGPSAPPFDELCQVLQRHMDGWAASHAPATDPSDGNFAYPPDERRAIARQYRAHRQAGIIANKEQWARLHYNISGRTLKRYEDEFPDLPQGMPTDT